MRRSHDRHQQASRRRDVQATQKDVARSRLSLPRARVQLAESRSPSEGARGSCWRFRTDSRKREAVALGLTGILVLRPSLLSYGGGWIQSGYRYALDAFPAVCNGRGAPRHRALVENAHRGWSAGGLVRGPLDDRLGVGRRRSHRIITPDETSRLRALLTDPARLWGFVLAPLVANLGLFLQPLAVLVVYRRERLLSAWFAIALVGPLLTFTNLYAVHTYYAAAVSPAVAALIGAISIIWPAGCHVGKCPSRSALLASPPSPLL
jgi:hypothetical protein